jgi:hypothetical protein
MLMKLADQHFGANDCGYKAVLTAFLLGEINHATSSLRNDGQVESVGRLWKRAGELHEEDVAIIQKRRKRRIRGELKAGVRLAHNHCCTEDAVALSRALDVLAAVDECNAEIDTEAPVGR